MNSPLEPTIDQPAIERTSAVWYLTGQMDQSDRIRRIALNVLPLRVGRRTDLGLALECDSVSKEHAELFLKNSELCVRDLGSTNGTFVNGQPIQQPTPLKEGDLVQFATVVFRLSRKIKSIDGATLHENACDRALAMVQFDRLMSGGGVVPFFQPIVQIDTKQIIGYEVLGRSRLFGLKNPAEMFAAASQLNLEAELSQLLRDRGMEKAVEFPEHLNIFLNTHPVELSKDGLIASLHQLRDANPSQPMTLEIHEAAIAEPDLLADLRDVLNELEMELAFDDFGVGRARLLEMSEVRPDFVKFDMKLTRDIHRATTKRQEVVALLVKMVNDLSIVSVAEGVECRESHVVLQQMNFKLGQGFYYGKPGSVTKISSQDGERDGLPTR